MSRYSAGSFRLLRVAGIDVFVHWSWFLVAALEVQFGSHVYQSRTWHVVSYLTFFFIVLLHEFGHALACRSVGGEANRIVLWPLGGVAYVSPPPRPGPVLWSIAAGPLVNVLLAPVLLGLFFLVCESPGSWPLDHDADRYLFFTFVANLIMLLFNLLPIYPLDGGQIAHALLWFFVGRWRSLQIISFGGMVIGASALVAAVIWQFTGQRDWQNWVLVFLAGYVAFRAFAGFRLANAVLSLLKQPRHEKVRCPACGEAPLAGPFWSCEACGAEFDTFACDATCPGCGKVSAATPCLFCRHVRPLPEWHGELGAREGPLAVSSE